MPPKKVRKTTRATPPPAHRAGGIDPTRLPDILGVRGIAHGRPRPTAQSQSTGSSLTSRALPHAVSPLPVLPAVDERRGPIVDIDDTRALLTLHELVALTSIEQPVRVDPQRAPRRQTFLFLDLVSMVAEFSSNRLLMSSFRLVCWEWFGVSRDVIDARLEAVRRLFDMSALSSTMASSAGCRTGEAAELPQVQLPWTPGRSPAFFGRPFAVGGTADRDDLVVRIDWKITKHARENCCDWYLTMTFDHCIQMSIRYSVSKSSWSKRVTVWRLTDQVVCTFTVIASSDDEDGRVKYVTKSQRKHPDVHYDFALCHVEGSVGDEAAGPSCRCVVPIRSSLQRGARNMLRAALAATDWPLEYFRRALPAVARW